MAKHTSCETLRDLCYAVQEGAAAAGHGKLTARPWNYFEPDRTPWWLVPSTRWPAYGQPKCFFFTTRLQAGQLATVHVEKGLGAAVREAFRSRTVKTHTMTDEWAWHRLAQRMSDGGAFDLIHRISTEQGADVLVSVLGGYLDQPDEFDRLDEDSLLKWDEALHVWHAGLKRLKLVRHRPQSKALGNLGFTFAPAEYAALLLKAAESPWAWIDVRIGVALLRPAPITQPGDLWTGADIWRRVLGPLMELLT